MSRPPKGLGLGLDALLGDSEPFAPPPPAPSAQSVVDQPVIATPPVAEPAPGPTTHLPIARIQAGQYQPRRQFDDQPLQELAESIRQHGLIQPILVRALTSAETRIEERRYEIIAGERRFRACSLAGLTEIPVIVREADDEQALALALIENIQRKDLNAIEEAKAISRLIDEFGYSHEQAAQSIGRSRSATSNLLRLLTLSDTVQQFVIEGRLDMGHARAVLPLSRAEQLMAANRIIEQSLSVRDAEKLVGKMQAEQGEGGDGKSGKRRNDAQANGPDQFDPDITRLETQLADMLATGVQIKPGINGRGKLIVDFVDAEHFDGLLRRLGLGSALDA